MRDVIVTAVILGLVPFILRSPFLGLLTWVWVGIMNPHRLAWGWATSVPFAAIIAAALFCSMLFNRDQLRKPPNDATVYFLLAFILWLNVSPMAALHPDLEYPLWSRALKIQIVVFAALFILKNRDQLEKLIGVLAVSVGFFAVKGGIFTLMLSGEYLVWGPAGSFIEDNNALAVATLMIVPLLRYISLYASKRWIRLTAFWSMPICVLSAIGSYSRGALLAVVAMGMMFALKSRYKIMAAVLGVLTVAVVLMVMPEQWYARMATIGTYNADSSALGRINAWWMAWNLASARFPIGGGFAIYEPDVFARYAPDPTDLHAAHSIYFQVLGEHGFVGLAIFLLIFIMAWRSGGWVIRHTRNEPSLAWARDLASMTQVSIVGFAVGGAFLSLTYFDLPYYLVVVLVALRSIVASELTAKETAVKLQRSQRTMTATSTATPRWQP